MRRFGKTPAARIGTAAFLSALKVLVRDHPGIAIEMVGVGLKKGGATGFVELKNMLTPDRSPDVSR